MQLLQFINKFFKVDEKIQDEDTDVPYLSLFRFATLTDKFLITIAALCSLLCGSFQPYMLELYGEVTDNIIIYVQVIDKYNTSFHKNITRERLYDSANRFAWYTSILGLLTVILTYISGVVLNYCASKQIEIIRDLYLKKLINQDIEWYDRHEGSEYVSTFASNLSKLQDGIGEKISLFLYFESAFVFGVIAALNIGWNFALVCVVSLPISIIIMSMITWISNQFSVHESESYSAAASVAEEVLSLIRTVIAFGGQKKEIEKYNYHLIYSKTNNIRRGFFKALNNGVMWLFIYCGYSLAFYYGIILIMEYRESENPELGYTPGKIIAIFSCILIGTWNCGMGTPIINIFVEAKYAASRLFYILDSEPIINNPRNVGIIPEIFDGKIEFEEVHFSYPTQPDITVLRGLNFSVNHGETLAIVGTSGSGKSTCIQLLQRFYDITGGKISIGNQDINQLNLNWLRQKIGCLNSQPELFTTTIAENIRYGNLEATQEDIVQAAQKARAHEFICRLQSGYQTIVNNGNEQLTSAQKQKIAIARTLVRKPEILLLDDVTSGMDANSETEIQSILDEVRVNCTTVLIASRLSAVKRANKIIVLSKGAIVEQGTHEDLVAAERVYYNLILSQDLTEIKDMDSGEEFETINISDDSSDDTLSTSSRKCDNLTWYICFWKIITLSKTEWRSMLIGALSSILTGVTPPVWAIIYGSYIGILAHNDKHYVVEVGNGYCLLFAIMGIVSAIATFLQIYSFTIVDENLTQKLRGDLFQSMLKQEVAWHERKENSAENLSNKLSEEADQVRRASGSSIGTLINFTTTFVMSTVVALYLQWKLALVLLSFSPIILLFIYFENNVLKVNDQVNINILEKSTNIILEAVNKIKTIASLKCEHIVCNTYQLEIALYEKLLKRKSHLNSFTLGISRSLMQFAYAAAISFSVHLIVNGEVEYGDTYKVSEAVIFGSWSIGTAFAFIPHFRDGLIATRKIFNLLARIPKVKDVAYATNKQWDMGNVQFSHVEFSYPSKPNSQILTGFNMNVFHGSSVAIVGLNGCGKSTVLRLLARLYDPTAGQITVDRRDLRLMSMQVLRSQIGIVSDDLPLFNRSIAENIAYGVNNKKVVLHDIMEAAKKANVHLFIKSLPMAYDTIVGHQGNQISSSQRQRIAIARALIRNPKILLLDESSFANKNSGKIIEETLRTSKKLRTCITVTQRLLTVQDVDRIFVMNEGKITEFGKHSELMEERGFYYKLYKSQLKQM